jgi:hypothetical protein
MFKFFRLKKQAKMQWVQYPRQNNVDNLKNARSEASRYYRKKNDLYTSSHIVRVVKDRRMRWARYIALMGKEQAYTQWGYMRERDHFGDAGVDRRITSINVYVGTG